MKKRFAFLAFLIFLLLSQAKVFAQEEILKKINQDVWYKFCQAFEQSNHQIMEQIHLEELIRVPADMQSIVSYNDYMYGYKRTFEDKKRKNQFDSISLRFIERIYNNSTASERGIYQLTINKDTDQERIFYGKFHVILKNVDGSWKILMDYDSNEGNQIGKMDFDLAADMDDFERFVKAK